MAAIVTGLIPILRTAVDTTATYKCRSLWFGLLCVRLVVLFFAELPFSKLDADFTCNSSTPSSSTPDVCTKFCFNERFDKPMIVAWNFMFVVVVISVLLMELFTSHLRTMAQKRSFRMKADEKPEAQGTEEDGGDGGRQGQDDHRSPQRQGHRRLLPAQHSSADSG